MQAEIQALSLKKCADCKVERGWEFSEFGPRGEKVFRDQFGKRWYHSICGYCFAARKRAKYHAERNEAVRIYEFYNLEYKRA